MRPSLFPASSRAALLSLFLAGVSPLLAQPAPLAYPSETPIELDDPVNALSRALRILAANPRDLSALTAAGNAALAVGDPAAAIGFFGRAEEISPRNGRIKAGLGSALVQMDQPREALRLFDQATNLGVPEADIAGDRGLAHDLRGEGRRAQADYNLALRQRADPEIARRLALSIAIGGDRLAAMNAIGPQIRAGDPAGLRTRAFIMALVGDVAGATAAVRQALPPAQADAMVPFLARMAELRDTQKAAAVHLGRFPSDGRRYSENELFADAAGGPDARPSQQRPAGRADAPLIPAGVPLGQPAATPPTQIADAASASGPALRAPRRRPGQVVPATTATGRPTTTSQPAQAADAARASAAPAAAPTATAERVPARTRVATTPPPATTPAATEPLTPPAVTPATMTATTTSTIAATTPFTPEPRDEPPPERAAAALPAQLPPAQPTAATPTPAPAATVAQPTIAAASPTAAAPAASAERVSAAAAATPPPPAATPDLPPASAVAAGTIPPTPAATRPLTAATPTNPSSSLPVETPTAVAQTATVPTRAAAIASGAAENLPAAPTPTAAASAPANITSQPPVSPAPAPARVASLVGPPDEERRAASPPAARAQPRPVPSQSSAAAPPPTAAQGTARTRPTASAASAVTSAASSTRRPGTATERTRDAAAAGDQRTRTAASDRNARSSATPAGRNDRTRTTPPAPPAREPARTAVTERYWVQVASGARKSDLPRAWENVVAKAPALLRGRQTWTAPWRASNRLLVGPFPTEAAAQAFVNRLGGAGVGGIQFTSRAGVDVERLPTR